MVFLQLANLFHANLFHKFVDKMTLHVLYFPVHEKRSTNKNPLLGVAKKISKRAAMDEYSLTPPPPQNSNQCDNMTSWQDKTTRQQAWHFHLMTAKNMSLKVVPNWSKFTDFHSEKNYGILRTTPNRRSYCQRAPTHIALAAAPFVVRAPSNTIFIGFQYKKQIRLGCPKMFLFRSKLLNLLQNWNHK